MHICMDEVRTLAMALPLVGLPLLWLKVKWRQFRSRKGGAI